MLTPALALLCLVATPAAALSPGDISAAARTTTSGLTVVRRLASDGLGGRDNATPESARAQRYILRRLRRLGDDAYRQPFVQSGQSGTNLLVVVRGRELPDEYVIVGAHYDHLGTRSAPDGTCRANGTPGGAVCNGATDNAAGVAAVLGVGRALRRLPSRPRRSIVLALWDAEEDGLLGSLYYVTHPVVPLGASVAYVNFDILGAQLVPSLADTTFAVSSETGGAALAAAVDAAAAGEPVVVRRLSHIFGQLRSDYANFVAHQVPTVFFSDSTGPCYHTTGDDVALVDFRKLRTQTRIAFRLVATLAEAPTAPAFVPPNPALATYGDAVVLRDVFETGLADLDVFPAAARPGLLALLADLRRIVADGAPAFDADDVGTLLNGAVQAIGAIDGLGCPPS
jgi:hypothetical protein